MLKDVVWNNKQSWRKGVVKIMWKLLDRVTEFGFLKMKMIGCRRL
jgi:hypothetical protein